jgi:K+ transporter
MRGGLVPLVIGALGDVYGDLGTSPLQRCCSGTA